MPDDNGTNDGSDNGQGGDGGQQQSAGGYKPPSSQEEFDRIIADRVNRTKNQFKDYNDLKDKASKFDELESKNRTDLERAQAERDAERERASTADQRAVKAEVKAIATGEFADPADVAAFLDLSKYLDSKGEIDSEAIETDLKELLKKKPYLGSTTTRTDVGLGPRGNASAPSMNDLIRRGAGR